MLRSFEGTEMYLFQHCYLLKKEKKTIFQSKKHFFAQIFMAQKYHQAFLQKSVLLIQPVRGRYVMDKFYLR